MWDPQRLRLPAPGPLPAHAVRSALPDLRPARAAQPCLRPEGYRDPQSVGPRAARSQPVWASTSLPLPPSRLPGRCPRLPRGRRAAAAGGAGRAGAAPTLPSWDVANQRDRSSSQSQRPRWSGDPSRSEAGGRVCGGRDRTDEPQTQCCPGGVRVSARGAGSPRWRGAGRWRLSLHRSLPGYVGSNQRRGTERNARKVRRHQAARAARPCAPSMPSLVLPHLTCVPTQRLGPSHPKRSAA